MSHVAIDALGARHSGAAMVVTELVRAALATNEVGTLTLFASPASERQFKLPVSPRLRVIERPRESGSTAARLAWLAGGLAWAARRERADVVLALSNAGSGWPLTPSALFIQQSLPFSREALATLARAERSRVFVIRETMRLAAHQARLVIVQTPWMREAVAASLGVSEDKIEVCTPGAPELAEPAQDAASLRELAAASAGRRVLYVGNRSAYKNVRVLEGAAAISTREHLALDWFGVGSGGSAAWQHLRELPMLDRAELHGAYRLADVLVMPSLVETVGLPLLEAMHCGLPIVAADRPYAHDICGDAAIYFDPNNSAALVSAVTRVLGDAALRASLVERGVTREASFTKRSPYAAMVARCLDLAARARHI